MSYSLTDYSATEVEFSDGVNTYYYRKCYCSVELQGEDIQFTAHKIEKNAGLQYWNVAYTDFTTPTGSAATVLASIKAIIENYAGGGGGSGTVTSVGVSMPSGFTVASSPVTTSGTIAITGAGASTDYIDGTGAIQPFPTAGNATQMITLGRNSTGATMYKGTVVYISGSTGNRPNFVKARADAESTSAGTFGVLIADLANNSDGYACTIGTIDNLDTRSAATNPFTTDTLADGDTIYLSPTTAGYVTNVKPYAPNHLVYIGKVVRTHPSLGTIVYRIQNGYELDELHNVQVQSPTNRDTIYFDSADSQWKTASIATITGNASASNTGVLSSTDWTTFNNKVTSVSGTAPVVSSGGTTPAISMPVATSSADGYLSSTDWSAFNNNLLGIGAYRKSGRWYNQTTFPASNGAQSLAANTINYLPVLIDAPITLTGLGINVTTAAPAASTARLGIYTNNASTTKPQTLLYDTGTFLVDTTGAKGVLSGASVSLSKGLYWFAINTNAASGAITGLGNNYQFDYIGLASIGGIGFARYFTIFPYAAMPGTAGAVIASNATTTYCIYYTF